MALPHCTQAPANHNVNPAPSSHLPLGADHPENVSDVADLESVVHRPILHRGASNVAHLLFSLTKGIGDNDLLGAIIIAADHHITVVEVESQLAIQAAFIFHRPGNHLLDKPDHIGLVDKLAGGFREPVAGPVAVTPSQLCVFLVGDVGDPAGNLTSEVTADFVSHRVEALDVGASEASEASDHLNAGQQDRALALEILEECTVANLFLAEDLENLTSLFDSSAVGPIAQHGDALLDQLLAEHIARAVQINVCVGKRATDEFGNLGHLNISLLCRPFTGSNQQIDQIR